MGMVSSRMTPPPCTGHDGSSSSSSSCPVILQERSFGHYRWSIDQLSPFHSVLCISRCLAELQFSPLWDVIVPSLLLSPSRPVSSYSASGDSLWSGDVTRRFTEWFNEDENDGNHMPSHSPDLNPIERLLCEKFWSDVLDSALHHHHQLKEYLLEERCCSTVPETETEALLQARGSPRTILRHLVLVFPFM